MTKLKTSFITILFAAVILISGCSQGTVPAANQTAATMESFSSGDIPEYTGSPYVVINNNNPFFTEGDFSKESFETYSDLDDLGRCGPAFSIHEVIFYSLPAGWFHLTDISPLLRRH